MVYSFNPSTQEAQVNIEHKAKPDLHRKFQASKELHSEALSEKEGIVISTYLTYIAISLGFASSSQIKNIFSHFINLSEQLHLHLLQDTEKQKGKQAMAEKHESEMSQVKQKSKKLLNVKKEIPTDVKGR